VGLFGLADYSASDFLWEEDVLESMELSLFGSAVHISFSHNLNQILTVSFRGATIKYGE
jgi:hypothetical protein